MTRPPDDEGRRLSEAAPSTTPTTTQAPKVTGIVADSGQAVAVDRLRRRAVNPLENAALAYQQAGWSIVPAAIEGKRALVPWKHWQQVAAGHEQLAQWARRWPRCNWAVITGHLSGVVVLDIDPRHRGDRALAELEQRHGDLPWLAVVETPSGGWHVYLRHPGGRLGNSQSRIGLGVDVRGNNGLALLPPSRRADGAYRWAVGGPDTIPPMPAAWAELLRPAPRLATCSTKKAPRSRLPAGHLPQAGRHPQRPPAGPRRAAQQLPLLVRQAAGRDGRPGRPRPLVPGPRRHRTGVRAGTSRDPRHPEQRPRSPAVTAERESAGHVNTQAVTVPTERHLALYQLLRSTSRDRNGVLVSWWPQDKLAAKLGCSVRTLQNVLGDLREPGTDPRHPRRAAGLRLGLVRVVPTTYRDKATGRHRLGGNAYVIVPGQHATLAEPVSPAQVNTQEGGVARLNKEGTSRGGYQGSRDGECEPASLNIAAVLEVGHQHEPSWADLCLNGDGVVDRLRVQLGEVEVVWPATPRWSNRRPSYRPVGEDARRHPLTRDLEDFHAAVDALQADTVPVTYYLKVTNRGRAR